MEKNIDLSGVLSKRSGLVYAILVFLSQAPDIPPETKAYVAGGVAAVYMVLDGIKSWKAKNE